MILLALYSNAAILKNSHRVKDRIRELDQQIMIYAVTDEGYWIMALEKGFRWNGRSGPRIIDLFVPNEGTEMDALGWLWHDAGGYPDTVSAPLDNDILRQHRILNCNDSKAKAWIIWKSVDVTKNAWKAYDWSEVTDKTYLANNGKIDCMMVPQ